MKHIQKSTFETHLHTGNAENNDKARHRGAKKRWGGWGGGGVSRSTRVNMSESDEDDDDDEDEEEVNLTKE